MHGGTRFKVSCKYLFCLYRRMVDLGLKSHVNTCFITIDAWWNSVSSEDYQAYIKWCEERRIAMQQQEEQRQLLEEIEQRAEAHKREMEMEKAQKEMQVNTDTLCICLCICLVLFEEIN